MRNKLCASAKVYIISKSKVESPKVPTTFTTTRKIIQYLWYNLYLKKKFSGVAATVVVVVIFRFLYSCRAYAFTSFALFSSSFFLHSFTHSPSLSFHLQTTIITLRKKLLRKGNVPECGDKRIFTQLFSRHFVYSLVAINMLAVGLVILLLSIHGLYRIFICWKNHTTNQLMLRHVPKKRFF